MGWEDVRKAVRESVTTPALTGEGMDTTRIPDEYIRDLEERSRSADRTTAYRATAELEDIADGDHWDGPRTDDPPASWWHAGGDNPQ